MSGFFRDARGLKPRNNIFDKIRGNAVSTSLHRCSEPQGSQLPINQYRNVANNSCYNANSDFNNESYDKTVGNSFNDDECLEAKFQSTVRQNSNKYQDRPETQEDLIEDNHRLTHNPGEVFGMKLNSSSSKHNASSENPTAHKEESSDNDDCEITDIKEFSNEPPNKPIDSKQGNSNKNNEYDGSADIGHKNGTSDTSVYSHSNEFLLEAFTNTQRMCSVLKSDLDKSKQENYLLVQKNDNYKDVVGKIKSKLIFLSTRMENMQDLSTKLTKEQEKHVLNSVEAQKQHTHMRTELNNVTKTLKEFQESYKKLQAEKKQLEDINLQKSLEVEILEKKILVKDNSLNCKLDKLMEAYHQDFNELKIDLSENGEKLASEVQERIFKNLEQNSKSITDNLSQLFLEKFMEKTKFLKDSNLKQSGTFERLNRDTEIKLAAYSKEITKKLNCIGSTASSNYSNLLEHINGSIVLRSEKLHELVMDQFSKSALSSQIFKDLLNEQLTEILQKTVDPLDFKNVLEKQATLTQENTSLTHKCNELQTEKAQHVVQIDESKNMIIELSRNVDIFKNKVDSQEQDFRAKLGDQANKLRNLENLKKTQDQVVELLEKDNKALKLDLATYSCDECLANSGIKNQVTVLEKQLQVIMQEKVEFQEKIFSLENQLENWNIQNNTHASHIVAKNAESTKNKRVATSTTATSEFELVSSAPELEVENTIFKAPINKKANLQVCVTALPREMNDATSGKTGKKMSTEMGSKRFECFDESADKNNDENKDDFFADQTLSFNTQLKTLLDTASKYKRKSNFSTGGGDVKFTNTECSSSVAGKKKNVGPKISMKTMAKNNGAGTYDVVKKANVTKCRGVKNKKVKAMP